MTWNSLHPVDHPWDDQRTPVVWVNWTFQPKNIPKNSLSRPLHQKKCQGEFFLGEFTQHFGGGGHWFLGHPPPKHTSHLSPSFQAARGRCIDLELAAKLASPTSTIAELSHDCQRPRGPRGIPMFRGNGWDLGSKDFFWGFKRTYPARVPVTNEGFIEILDPKNVTCHPGGNDCGLKGEISSCNLPLLFLMVPL